MCSPQTSLLFRECATLRSPGLKSRGCQELHFLERKQATCTLGVYNTLLQQSLHVSVVRYAHVSLFGVVIAQWGWLYLKPAMLSVALGSGVG